MASISAWLFTAAEPVAMIVYRCWTGCHDCLPLLNRLPGVCSTRCHPHRSSPPQNLMNTSLHHKISITSIIMHVFKVLQIYMYICKRYIYRFWVYSRYRLCGKYCRDRVSYGRSPLCWVTCVLIKYIYSPWPYCLPGQASALLVLLIALPSAWLACRTILNKRYSTLLELLIALL